MVAGLAAVVQDVGVVATGVLQGIGQNGQAVEVAFVINGGGERNDGGSEPGGVGDQGRKGLPTISRRSRQGLERSIVPGTAYSSAISAQRTALATCE